MAERQVRGLLYGPTTYFQVIADKLIALAARYRIPPFTNGANSSPPAA
jgi:hypothetical protein